LSDDLKGIRVEHDIEEFEVGASEILVAKDVDVLVQEDDEVALVIPTRVFVKPSKPKVAFSFEDEEAEDDKGFVIGEVRTILPSADDVAAAERRTVFDTNLGATTEIVSSGPVKRKRQSRKKEFSDVPVFQPRNDVEMVPATAPFEEEEDDFSISRAIVASRQRNIEMIRERLLAGEIQEEEDSEMTESAGYRDGTSLLALNTFMESIKRPERAKEDAACTIHKAEPLKVDVSQVADRQMESLLDEPLVSSSLGVGKALEFLRIRGRPLTLVKEHRNVRDIKLAYYDEFGNEISAKEAYKSLSHKFHGNKSGKNKEEKRLKRIQERQQSKAAVLVGDGSKAAKRVKPKRQKPALGAGSSQTKLQEANVTKKPKVFGFK
jgi:hypothetical protein